MTFWVIKSQINARYHITSLVEVKILYINNSIAHQIEKLGKRYNIVVIIWIVSLYIYIFIYIMYNVWLFVGRLLGAGWKFGAVFSRSGAFPAECVRPITPPDFLSLPLDRTTEPRGGAGQFATSSAIAVAVASTMAAYEIDQTIEVEVPSHADRFPFPLHFFWRIFDF